MEALTNFLVSQGVLGVAALVVGWVAWIKDRDNKDLNKEMRDMWQRQIESNSTVADALRELSREVRAK